MRSFLTVQILVALITGLAASATSWAQQVPPPSKPPRPMTPPQTPPDMTPPFPRKPGEKSGDQLVKVRGLADVSRIKPGQPFQLAFVFDIEPRWHIYWQNAGASGLPTEIKVTAPSGYTIGKTHYPRPIAITGEEGITYGYENQTVLFVDVTPPSELLPGRVSFTANINWLVCKEKCLAGRARTVVDVPTGAMDAPGGEPAVEPIIAEYKQRLPQDAPRSQGFDARFDRGTLTIRLPARGKDTAEFFPLASPGVTYGAPDVRLEQGRFLITVPVETDPNNALGEPMVIAGVVGIGSEQSEACYSFEIPLPAP